MATRLLTAALGCNIMDENPLQATGCMHGASGKAISHKKKRESGDADDGESAKTRKVGAVCTFTQASDDDGKLQCIFVEGECIPLWPQYLTADGSFIKVDTQENWVIHFMVACRKSILRGCEPQTKTGRPERWSRALVKYVCNELRHEFRRVIYEARKKHRKSAREQFPDVLAIKMHEYEVMASSCARNFCIRIDENAVTWIHNGLRRAVTGYLGVDLRAMSHTASKDCGDKPTSQARIRAGVRDKVQWKPEKCSWELTFKGACGEDKVYCNEHGIKLHIEPARKDSEFKAAQDKAFHDACMVWNAVDKSGKKRITMGEQSLHFDMVPLISSKAMSHTDSEHETEVPTGPDDEEDLFGDDAE